MDKEFLARSADLVAPDLLGYTLVRKIGGVEYRGLIVETEAYTADDPACHGYRRKTPRNQAIFGKPGSVYVYLIYGMYHCLNIVTDVEDVCSAVLIRALALDKIPAWVTLGKKEKPDRVAAGPGKLCRALQIDRQLDGIMLKPGAGLWLEPASDRLKPAEIYQTTRIGITQGAEIPWRWYIKEHPAVSKK
ncbi:3-methyladenine DNA glycosylase [Thalassoporum mexicanum PCC 7367]|uniref:DNA-3-methyladenine glycosylase n=1 Tax=Thalassoporum mexicanum TaxID=3457544 RepID=UPI00029FF6AD|nr:DNA-3-methyladenine glycosylase [Pseudanabaena sp. PCC 7367]AFY69083.1 3-methyladenine DNA glycosylase [Pseudanabaena sp. PCC 7367]